ncbi:MAG: HAMP domain-containing protein [Mesorhizobium sp.]
MAIKKASAPVVPAPGKEPSPGATSALVLFWQNWPLRTQILAVFIAIIVTASAAALSLIVFNAKRAIELEVSSAVGGVERMVQEIVRQPGNISIGLQRLRDLPRTTGAFRHVTVSVIGGNDMRAAILPAPQSNLMGSVPHWFSALLGVPEMRREVQVIADGHHIGSVLIVGNSADEIVKVWQDVRDLALLAAAMSLAVILLFRLALGRVLKPLGELATGLQQLEIGNFRQRLQRPPVKELGNIIDGFNALAERLDASKKSNQALSQKLVTAQDEERRVIATELHDEWGPCLFGIKANIASLDFLAKGLPPKKRNAVQERLEVVDAIADKFN